MSQAFCYISNAQGGGDWQGWRTRLGEALGESIDIRPWSAHGDPRDIEIALAWKPPAGALASLPNLKLIVSLGMGVDHLLIHPDLPRDIPIVRIIDTGLVGQMSEYAIYWALHHHRDVDGYMDLQRRKQWEEIPFTDTALRRVGILGLGEIGADTARKFAMLGFPTAGWSRTPRRIDGIDCLHGPDGLQALLARSDILIDVLPMTPQTANLLDARAFARLPKGAYFINMARGGHVVDADLLAALDSGHLDYAILDVHTVEEAWLYRKERMDDSPLWTHPKILLSPHGAGHGDGRHLRITELFIDNLTRFVAGENPLPHEEFL